VLTEKRALLAIHDEDVLDQPFLKERHDIEQVDLLAPFQAGDELTNFSEQVFVCRLLLRVPGVPDRLHVLLLALEVGPCEFVQFFEGVGSTKCIVAVRGCLTRTRGLCEHPVMGTTSIRAGRWAFLAAVATPLVLAACGSTRSRLGDSSAPTETSTPSDGSRTYGGSDAGDAGPSYVVIDDAGYLVVGDALLSDPEFRADHGHPVGVDGGLAAATVCSQNSDCTWVLSRCSCYWPERGDVQGLNVRYIDHWVYPWCEQPCTPMMSPWLIPTCVASRCEVADIQQSAITSCTTMEDCRIRVRECCECGGDTDIWRLIALARQRVADYEALVCDMSESICDPCLANYPPTQGLGLIAALRCIDGHCAVTPTEVDPAF
jgi:hypothetical protein